MQVECRRCSGLDIVYDALRICYDTPVHKTPEEKEKYVHAHSIIRGHDSVLEHLIFTFTIEELERLILIQLEKHRISSMTVESTRYTLRKILSRTDILKLNQSQLEEFFVFPQGLDALELECFVDYLNGALAIMQMMVRNGKVEQAKYATPESYKTKLFWTINARSLRNFLKLRYDKHASPAHEQLAKYIYVNIPEHVKFLFEDIETQATLRGDTAWI